MMTISGKSETPWLYVHDILALHEAMVNNQLPTAGGGNELPQQEGSTLQKLRDKCSKRIDDKLFPTNYKFHSRRVPNTKGCRACAVRTNHYADDKTRYLVAALEKQILLMEWYEPMNRFKEVKRVDYRSPRLSSAGIRLVINKNQQYRILEILFITFSLLCLFYRFLWDIFEPFRAFFRPKNPIEFPTCCIRLLFSTYGKNGRNQRSTSNRISLKKSATT